MLRPEIRPQSPEQVRSGIRRPFPEVEPQTRRRPAPASPVAAEQPDPAPSEPPTCGLARPRRRSSQGCRTPPMPPPGPAATRTSGPALSWGTRRTRHCAASLPNPGLPRRSRQGASPPTTIPVSPGPRGPRRPQKQVSHRLEPQPRPALENRRLRQPVRQPHVQPQRWPHRQRPPETRASTGRPPPIRPPAI